MVEFFQNLWQWVVSNKDAIVAVLTSANFISFITSIILLVKTMKATKNNTASSKALDSSVASLNNMNNIVIDTYNMLADNVNSFNCMKQDYEDFKAETLEALKLLTEKINAMLEVQSTVYSTIKDDSMRTNISNIVTNARYKETSDIVEMRTKIEALQSKLEAKATDIKNDVAKTVDEVKKVVKTTKNSIMR